MGMHWKEEIVEPRCCIRYRFHAVGIIQDDSDFNDDGFLYDEESSELDDAEAYPHIVPVDPDSPKHSSR
ncbi:MAG: hypothetical protein WC956_05870 [bacterium]